ncbi:hypothetical protein HID58_061538 [Brassica napus]|uniref:FBD domain-containing protein n=1 Tax=Brassica napus TaxID=3708 RepID=A0ABQ7ZZG1_BRANA|nr:hypothetical protein HID58_061538 [Brassica napus]
MGFFGYYVRIRKRKAKRSKLCRRSVPVCKDITRSINDLSDELLIKILSFLPTKVAVSTSILSKQWQFLWMWLPKLEYSSLRYYSESSAPREFIDKYLPLHRAPFLAMYMTWIFIIVQWIKIYFRAAFIHDESLQGLLDICPVLEDLSVLLRGECSMGEITVIVPTLQRLSLSVSWCCYIDGYVIDTPSLKYFKLEDWYNSIHDVEIKDMPELREAYVDVVFFVLKSVIGSITSVKHLTICSEIPKRGWEDEVYGGGFLEHLKLCVCKDHSSDLLGQLLKDSPNLRVLDVFHTGVCWKQPSQVPQCLLSSLQIFNWSGYFGRAQERDIAVYILKNACCLEKVTIFADIVQYSVPHLNMIKELAFSSRASTTCELVFVECPYEMFD